MPGKTHRVFERLLDVQAASPPMIEAMSRADFYPHPCDTVDAIQTVTSWLLFAGDRVYKVRKPVCFWFVDASTPTKRFRLTHQEVFWSRRLASDIYYGVAAIAFTGQRYTLIPEANPADRTRCDFAVVMRLLPRDRMLDRMVAGETVRPAEVHDLAEHLSDFHRRASIRESRLHGSAPAVARLVIQNIQDAERVVADSIAAAHLASMKEFSRDFLKSQERLLDRRVIHRRVRQGHGDLRCDSVSFAPEGIAIINHAESSASRCADVISEIASLSIDLELAGRADLADELVQAYTRFAQDSEMAQLLPFYKCYRGVLRGRLETLVSLQREIPLEQRILARGNASRSFAIAHHYAEHAERQRV